MIYLDMSAEDFFHKYPSLKEEVMDKCNQYNLNINEIKPFRTSGSVGVVLNPREKTRPMTLRMISNEDLNYNLISKFKDVLQ